MTRNDQTITTQRLETLSDGVIAIAATLLVLQIERARPSNAQSLFDAVVDQWPAFVAYVVSFSVIALIWVAHHSMFERLHSVDRAFVLLNLLLLLVVGFIPWPTSLLADYIGQANHDAAVATAVYSTTMTAIGLIFSAMWAHLVRHPEHAVPGITRERLRRSLHRSYTSPIVYGATIGLSFVSPPACLVVYGLLGAYFVWGPSARALMGPAPDPGATESSEASDQARSGPLGEA